MCTVTIIATRTPGLRLVTNRDVLRDRAEATAPAWHTDRRIPAVWPTDPDGGGTWVGASDSGLVLCLLNNNPEPPIDVSNVPGLTSRGVVIPRLIDSLDAPRAIEGLSSLDLSVFAPFRLVACDLRNGRPRIVVGDWDRQSLRVTEHETPACFVSSGLGDSKALPRLPLFDQRVREGDPATQDAFHRHRWSQRPEISVLMSRPDARTVSITSVDVSIISQSPRVRMTLEPVWETADVPSA